MKRIMREKVLVAGYRFWRFEKVDLVLLSFGRVEIGISRRRRRQFELTYPY